MSYARPTEWYSAHAPTKIAVCLEGLGISDSKDIKDRIAKAAIAQGKLDFRTSHDLGRKTSLLNSFVASVPDLDRSCAPNDWFLSAVQVLLTKSLTNTGRRKTTKSDAQPPTQPTPLDLNALPTLTGVGQNQGEQERGDTPRPRQIQQHDALRPRLVSPTVPAVPNLLLRFSPQGGDGYELISATALYGQNARVASLDQLVREIKNRWDGHGGLPIQIAFDCGEDGFSKTRDDLVLDMVLRDLAAGGNRKVNMRVTVDPAAIVQSAESRESSVLSHRHNPNSPSPSALHPNQPHNPKRVRSQSSTPERTRQDNKRLRANPEFKDDSMDIEPVNGKTDATTINDLDLDTEMSERIDTSVGKPLAYDRAVNGGRGNDSYSSDSSSSDSDEDSHFEHGDLEQGDSRDGSGTPPMQPKVPEPASNEEKVPDREETHEEAREETHEEAREETHEEAREETHDEAGEESELKDQDSDTDTNASDSDDSDDSEEEDAYDRAETNKSRFSSNLYNQAVQDSQMARVDDRLLALTMAYFPLLDRDQLRSSAPFCLPNVGLAKGFRSSPFQLFGAVWSFDRERGGICRGGTNADEAGSGKTVEMLLLYLLNYLHYQNVEFVSASWKLGKEGRKWTKTGTNTWAEARRSHLPEDAPPGNKCPSAHLQPIACYCEPDNRSRLYLTVLKPGVRINFTPAAGLRSFQNDAIKMFEGGAIMNRDVPPRIAIEAEEFCDHDWLGGLTQKEVATFAKEPAWQERKKYEREHPSQIVNKRTDAGEWFEVSVTGPVSTDDTATTTRASRHSSSVLIVTTPGCYPKRVNGKFTVMRTSDWKQHGTGTKRASFLNAGKYLVLQIAAIAWDECQLTLQGNVIPDIIKDATVEYKTVYGIPIAFTAFSGTPDQGNPLLLMRLLVDALRIPAWDTISPDHPELAGLVNLNVGRVDSKKKDFDKLCERAKSGASRPTEDKSYQPLLRFIRDRVPSLQLRRTSKTRWFDGMPLIPKACQLVVMNRVSAPSTNEAELIKTMEKRVRSEVNRVHKDRLEEWLGNPRRRETDKPKKPSIQKAGDYNIARVTASVAALTSVWEADAEGDTSRRFSIKDELVASWLKDTEHSLTDVLEEDEMADLCKIRDVLKVCAWAKKRKRGDGSRSKVLIASRYPLVRAAMNGLLNFAYPDREDMILRYDTGMNQRDRDTALNKFDNDENVFIMIINLRSAGVALNVQRASVAIMMEPSHKIAELVQFFARIDRRGQTEPFVWGIVLRNAASKIEDRMGNSNNFHQMMQDSLTNAVDADGAFLTERTPLVLAERPDLDPFLSGAYGEGTMEDPMVL